VCWLFDFRGVDLSQITSLSSSNPGRTQATQALQTPADFSSRGLFFACVFPANSSSANSPIIAAPLIIKSSPGAPQRMPTGTVLRSCWGQIGGLSGFRRYGFSGVARPAPVFRHCGTVGALIGICKARKRGHRDGIGGNFAQLARLSVPPGWVCRLSRPHKLPEGRGPHNGAAETGLAAIRTA
jgi:hypothetical protein